MNKKSKDNLIKEVFALAVPIMIQNGITNAAGLIDNLMVGSISTEAMTAVSIASQLIFVFNLAIFGGMSGPGIYGAQYYGNNDTEGVRNVFRIKLWIGTICTLIGIGVFFFFDRFLLGLYMTDIDSKINAALTMEYAVKYLRIMLMGLAPFTVTQIYSTSLRETNESFKPMVAGLVSVVVNIFFNWLLIYGELGFPKLGVEGAAIATVICRFAECAVAVIWPHIRVKEHEFLKGLYRTLFVRKEIVLPILKKSLPILLNEFLWAGGVAALTQCYSVKGLIVVTSINISNSLCNLLNVVFIAMGHAVGIIIGQYLGAGEFDKAKKKSVLLMWLTAGICVILSVALIALSGIFPNMYTSAEPDVKAAATKFIIITAFFFPLQGFLNSLYFTLRSGGKTLVTFLFDSCFSWVVSVPVAFVLSRFSGLNIYWIYACVNALDLIKVIIGFILIKKGVWISNLVKDEGVA